MKNLRYILLVFTAAGISISVAAQWTQQSSGTLRPFSRVFFASANVGYAMPFSGPMFRTLNGGASWDSLGSITVSGDLFNGTDLIFLNDSTGFLSSSSGTYLSLYKTSNRGNSWTQVNPDDSLAGALRIHFSDAQNGFAFCNRAPWFPKFYRTTNGGSSWFEPLSGFQIEASIGLPYMQFVNDSTGYLTGSDGTFAYRGVIARTGNSGQSWKMDTLPQNSMIHALHFPNADTGYAISNTLGIFRTTNAGASWDSISDFVLTHPARDVHFMNGKTGYLISEGDIYRSTDAGLNWTLSYQGSKILYDLYFLNGRGYAAGDSGAILKTGWGTGIKKTETAAFDLKLYPNPNSGIVNFEVDADLEGTVLQIELFNVLGQTVYTGEISSPLALDLPGGIYHYSINLRDHTTLKNGKLLLIR